MIHNVVLATLSRLYGHSDNIYIYIQTIKSIIQYKQYPN